MTSIHNCKRDGCQTCSKCRTRFFAGQFEAKHVRRVGLCLQCDPHVQEVERLYERLSSSTCDICVRKRHNLKLLQVGPFIYSVCEECAVSDKRLPEPQERFKVSPELRAAVMGDRYYQQLLESRITGLAWTH